MNSVFCYCIYFIISIYIRAIISMIYINTATIIMIANADINAVVNNIIIGLSPSLLLLRAAKNCHNRQLHNITKPY